MKELKLDELMGSLLIHEIMFMPLKKEKEKKIKEQGGVKHLGLGKDGFSVFKDMIEVIWDYLSDNRRKVFKVKDFTPTNGKKNESYDHIEYTVFDKLLEDFYNDEYDEETEYEYDVKIINERKSIASYEDYLNEIY